MSEHIVTLEESIQEIFKNVYGPNDPPLSIDSENDRCWVAGWLRAVSEKLGPCGMARHYAAIVRALDIPPHQKQWTFDPKWN
jgi:hypothetical protein